MRKRISVMLAAIASAILIVILLFTAVTIAINDGTFINNEYTKLGLARTMNMNNADLVHACTTLIDYMQGKVDSIDIMVTVNGQDVLMFDQAQEVTHMKDVRQLYAACEHYRDLGLLVMLVLYLLAATLSFRDAILSIAKGYLWGAFLMMLVLGFLGTWAALDFGSFWTAFHQALFWNDLWLFDAATSRMINILPEQFFADLVTRIVTYGGAAIVALLVAAILTVITQNKKRAAAAEAARAERLAARAAKAAGKTGAAAQAGRAAKGPAAAGDAPVRRKKRPAADGRTGKDAGKQAKPAADTKRAASTAKPAAGAPVKRKKKRSAAEAAPAKRTAPQAEAPAPVVDGDAPEAQA